MSRAKRIKQAARRFERFTGHVANKLETREVTFPDTVLQVGDCLGILYETVRDGRTERYIHKFRKSSRPQLHVSHDGKFLVVLGGAFQFTDRGIVDR